MYDDSLKNSEFEHRKKCVQFGPSLSHQQTFLFNKQNFKAGIRNLVSIV